MSAVLPTRSARASALLLGVVLLASLTAQSASAQESSPTPVATPPTESSPERPTVAKRGVARNNGVEVTMRLDAPIVAGEPVRLRTRVRNTNDEPIWWSSGREGLLVDARMTDATWRFGEPLAPLPREGEPGFPARTDLKNMLVSYAGQSVERILPSFRLRRVDGIEDSSLRGPERIPPGRVTEFVHEWDGFARLHLDQDATAGLPPNGPVEVTATANYRLSPEGRQRRTRARLEAKVVDGWDDERLQAMEFADAALADPAFAELVDGLGDDTCDLGSWRTTEPE